MLGFDTDKPDIFERQIKLVEEAKIVHSSVGMVTAIPKTPLYARMLTANRLDLADRTPFGTNIIPVSMQREELRDGYINVLRGLYSPGNNISSAWIPVPRSRSRREQASSDGDASRSRYSHAANGVLCSSCITIFIFNSSADRSEGARALPGTTGGLRTMRCGRRPNPFVLQTYAIKIGHALPLPPFARRNAGEFGRTSNQHILSYRAALVEQFIGGSERRKARLSQCYARITFIRARCDFNAAGQRAHG